MAKLRRWQLVPHLLLRRAGFPFSLIERLHSPAAAAALEVVRAAQDADRLRQELLRERFPAEVSAQAAANQRNALKLLSRARRRVGKRQTVSLAPGPFSAAFTSAHQRWNAAQREVDGAVARLE